MNSVVGGMIGSVVVEVYIRGTSAIHASLRIGARDNSSVTQESENFRQELEAFTFSSSRSGDGCAAIVSTSEDFPAGRHVDHLYTSERHTKLNTSAYRREKAAKPLTFVTFYQRQFFYISNSTSLYLSLSCKLTTSI